jgi:hypothetical protein
MPHTIKVKRVVEQVEKCEIFTFPAEVDRQDFIADLRKLSPEATYAINMDPDESEPERYLVAVPIRFYEWVTQEEQ